MNGILDNDEDYDPAYDSIEVTLRARDAGWTLPPGWRVMARTEPDDIDDPREKGEVYNTDVDEEDYNHPTRAFCMWCESWIRELDADAITGMGPDAEGREPEPGDWADLATGIDCPGSDDRRHEPDEPVAVRWWRKDRWRFVGVIVHVLDPQGERVATESLWSVESGECPYAIDRDTGQITSKQLDPLTDEHHPLPDLIGVALGEAQEKLAAQRGGWFTRLWRRVRGLPAVPVITAPHGVVDEAGIALQAVQWTARNQDITAILAKVVIMVGDGQRARHVVHLCQTPSGPYWVCGGCWKEGVAAADVQPLAADLAAREWHATVSGVAKTITEHDNPRDTETTDTA